MARKTLEDVRASVDREGQDILGETISYQLSSGQMLRIKAQIDYGEQVEAWGGIQSRGQNFEIFVLKTDVPVVSVGDRITGLKVAGTFMPKGSAANANEGTGWFIEVERVR